MNMITDSTRTAVNEAPRITNRDALMAWEDANTAFELLRASSMQSLDLLQWSVAGLAVIMLVLVAVLMLREHFARRRHAELMAIASVEAKALAEERHAELLSAVRARDPAALLRILKAEQKAAQQDQDLISGGITDILRHATGAECHLLPTDNNVTQLKPDMGNGQNG